MVFPKGARLGPYEILGLIGAGGMGEVYHARDSRLDRAVAIKILPAQLADSERRQRFEREARVISTLSHPNICSLYDVGHQDGIDFLVMEYLEGETLAARLAKGPLPPDQVVRCALQIVQALVHAHRHGVLHRDLKPGNVMITRAGIKLLDFGLAKVSQPPFDSALSESPTLSQDLTAKGAILGTLQYMAPEQLEGKPTDARSDIFSFGAVFYEIATGRRAFPGQSPASVIASILKQDPSPLDAGGAIPPTLDRVIRRCLAKDPDSRWQTALDLATGIEWAVEGGPEYTHTGNVRTPASARLAWVFVAALLVTIGILVLITARGRETPRQTQAIRFAVSPPEKTTLSPAAPAVSPDGTLLAFLAVTEGRSMVWIRAIDSIGARPLPGSDLASTMFWSADSRFLAFVAGGKLKKIELSTGSVSTICDARVNSQGDWNNDGAIIFSLSSSEPLYRVPAAGGIPSRLTTLDGSRADLLHSWPQWLPNGREFLYFVRTSLRETTGIYAASLDSPTSPPKLIAESYAAGRYAPDRNNRSGRLLFLNGDTLMAQPFDHSTHSLTGEPMRVAEGVGGLMQDYAGNPGFSISRNGVLAYHNIKGPRAQLVWLDRAGVPAETITVSDIWSHPRLSWDGNRVAFERPDSSTLRNDIWVGDVKRGVTSRLTHDPASDGVPIWSPDGERIVYNSIRNGSRNLYWNTSSGGQEELLLQSAESKVPVDWSPDGKFILFLQGDERSRLFDLWALPVAGDRKPFPVVQSAFSETHAQFSPDGRWVVYASNETGLKEVYARPFRPSQPASSLISETVQITGGGGSHPRWRRDGRELFYLSPESRIMAVPVTIGPNLEVGKSKFLFQVRGGRPFDDILYDYDVTADGQRFLFNLSIEGAVSPITVVVNWDAAWR